MVEVARDQLSYTDERIHETLRRGAVSMDGLPEDREGVWGVENVAVLPEYRGRGLTDRLFGCPGGKFFTRDLQPAGVGGHAPKFAPEGERE